MKKTIKKWGALAAVAMGLTTIVHGGECCIKNGGVKTCITCVHCHYCYCSDGTIYISCEEANYDCNDLCGS
jgi:hypothetical protein